jgi:dienelactone hydrolase
MKTVDPENSSTSTSNFSVERITFQSAGETLVGNLYLPKGATADSRLPALVVTGAWMTVKEQMPAVYAREMAARGLIALAFDFRTWGESGGEPRSVEDPFVKVIDIIAAAEFLATRPEVNSEEVAGLGVCASGAYMATAATQTDCLKSIALIAPGLPSRQTVEANVGGPAAVQALINASRQAQAAYEATGQSQLVPAASLTDKRAVMFGVPYYTEVDRGLIPEWDNTFNLASWERWLAYDAQAAAPLLGQPLFVVHSEAAAIPQSAREFIAMVPRHVDQLWLEGVAQFDFYDRPGPVRASSDAVAAHFKKTLRSPK